MKCDENTKVSGKLKLYTYLGKLQFVEVEKFVSMGDIKTCKCEEEYGSEVILGKVIWETNRCAGRLNHTSRTKQSITQHLLVKKTIDRASIKCFSNFVNESDSFPYL